MALSDWDKKHLDLNQQRAVQTYTAEWEKAKRAGNTERMRWAHNGAETIRRQAGYSGGKEGSTFLPAQDTAKTTNTGTAGKANQQKGYDNGSLTTQQVKQLQKALGVAQDGYFGPKTQAAAFQRWGASNADAAMKSYTSTSTPARTSFSFDEDEGIYHWNGQTFTTKAALTSAMNSANLSAAEKNIVGRKTENSGSGVKLQNGRFSSTTPQNKAAATNNSGAANNAAKSGSGTFNLEEEGFGYMTRPTSATAPKVTLPGTSAYSSSAGSFDEALPLATPDLDFEGRSAADIQKDLAEANSSLLSAKDAAKRVTRKPKGDNSRYDAAQARVREAQYRVDALERELEAANAGTRQQLDTVTQQLKETRAALGKVAGRSGYDAHREFDRLTQQERELESQRRALTSELTQNGGKLTAQEKLANFGTGVTDLVDSVLSGGDSAWGGVYGALAMADEATGNAANAIKRAVTGDKSESEPFISPFRETAQYHNEKAADTLQRASEGRSNLGRRVMSTGQAAGNMLAMSSLGALTGGTGAGMGATFATSEAGLGAGTAQQAATKLVNLGARIGNEILSHSTNALISAGSAGHTYLNATDSGADQGKAMANAIGSGLVEYFSNKMFSGTPLEDTGEKGYVTRLIEYAADRLGKSEALGTFLNSALGKGAGVVFDKLGEGFEEVITAIGDPLLERLTWNPEADMATVNEIVDSFAGGLALSIFMSGGEAVIDNAARLGDSVRGVFSNGAAPQGSGVDSGAGETLTGAPAAGNLTPATNRDAEARISPQSSQTQNAAPGMETTRLPRMSMSDFANTESPVWNNVDYGDMDTQQQLMRSKHQEMVDAGEVVTVPERALNEVAQAYPDLRDMKKSERTPILKQKMGELKATLRNTLGGLKGAYEFEVNGNILEARLYDTGVREVMQNITQPKAAMLTQSGDIFRNAQYLYSTPDYEGNPNIYRWNYFYTPVRIGDQTVGVRIAVRDMKKTGDSQIYHWGIKENTPLGGEGGGESASRNDASSGVFPADALGGGRPGTSPNTTDASSAATVDEDSIAQPSNAVKGEPVSDLDTAERAAQIRQMRETLEAETEPLRRQWLETEYTLHEDFLQSLEPGDVLLDGDGVDFARVAGKDALGLTLAGTEGSDFPAVETILFPQRGEDGMILPGTFLDGEPGQQWRGHSVLDYLEPGSANGVPGGVTVERGGGAGTELAGQGDLLVMAARQNNSLLQVDPAQGTIGQTNERGGSNDGRQGSQLDQGARGGVSQGEESQPAHRRASESLRGFLQRMDQERRAVREAGGYRYGYRPVPLSEQSANARAITEELAALGVDSIVYDGELQANNGKTTFYAGGDAQTLKDGSVAVPNSADGILSAREIAAHETAHSMIDQSIPQALAFKDAVRNNLDLGSDAANEYLIRIADKYFEDGFDLADGSQKEKLLNELCGYISGHLYDGSRDISDMFLDADAVSSAWQAMIDHARRTAGWLDNRPLSAADTYQNADTFDEEGGAPLATPEPETGMNDSLGSARSGFDPFSAAENKYGTMDGGMKAVRPDDVPVSTNGKDHVSRSVVSMKGAAVTPDTFVPLIENETMKGGFSYIPITNDATTSRAESYIKRHGWEEALRNWTADVRAHRSGPDSTAIGALLYNNAVNSGNYQLALDILADFQDYATNTAQALQAIRILKTLTPENRLYMIERQLTKYNEQAAAQKRERNKQRNLTDADNVPVEEWMTRVGEDLADQLVKQGNVEKPRAKTVAETILSDLKQFYADDGKPGAPEKTAQTRENRTELDRIYDLFQNQEQYQEAWDAARAKLAKELDGDPEAMAAYDAWFRQAPDYTKRLARMLTGEETLSISKELADRYLNAQTEAERDAVIEEMQKEIAEQLPSTLLDKWNALRYLNMLGNFKTQIRNVAGNVGMQAMTRAKDAVAAGIENLAYAVTGGKFERTKALLPGKALRDAARADFSEVEKMAMGESRYDLNEGKHAGSTDIVREAMDQRTIFKHANGKQGPVYKALEAYRNATNWAMEQGDVIFSRASYSNALAGWLKAHNVTAEQFTDPEWRKANSKLVDTARSYAIQEAQEATFRDTNTVSKLVSSAGRGKNVPSWAQVLGEGLMPFRKTPANVAVRAVEYGPLGVINSAASAVRMGLSSTNLVNRTGLMGALARSGVDITGTDVINELAKGLTGSALFVLGYWLRRNGFLRGGDDDDQNQEYFDDLNGHQNYALELPDGTSYTLDWVTPGAIPLFMGTALADGVKEGGLQLSDIEGAFTQIAEPMLQMSMLSSINDTLDSLKYSKDNLGQLAGTLVFSYLTQGFTNTLLGQIERTAETERMSTYVEHDSAVPSWLQRQLGKASAKTPGWDYHQYPYIDAWGRTESSGDVGTRAFTYFASPGYLSKVSEGVVEDELQRLADSLGDTNLFPDNADKSFSVNGTTRYLTREEYVEYAAAKGSKSFELISDLIGDEGYNDLNDEERAKAIKDLYAYANAKAKQETLGIPLNATAAKIEDVVQAGIDPTEYLIYNAKFASLTPEKGKKDVSDMQKFRVIAAENMPDQDKIAAIGAIMGTDMTTESGGKSQYAKMLDLLDSGLSLDQYLDLKDADAVDTFMNYQAAQRSRDYGVTPGDFISFKSGKEKYDADSNGSYTQKEVRAAIDGIFGNSLTNEQKAVLWQMQGKNWAPKNNPYSKTVGQDIYDGWHEEPLPLAAP